MRSSPPPDKAQTTERVSGATDGTQGTAHSLSLAISADGRFGAFCSVSTNLVILDSNGGVADVYVTNRVTGTTERIVASDGTQGNLDSSSPS